MTHEDLEKYTVKVDDALQGTYHDKIVYTSLAPTSGPILLHILNLLERYNLVGEGGRTGLNIHRFVEALKCEHSPTSSGSFISPVLTV
jgi:gamma-glutamyltranspeptidase/glutathione hydrolase/leukotriene-C4 hydrolase